MTSEEEGHRKRDILGWTVKDTVFAEGNLWSVASERVIQTFPPRLRLSVQPTLEHRLCRAGGRVTSRVATVTTGSSAGPGPPTWDAATKTTGTSE